MEIRRMRILIKNRQRTLKLKTGNIRKLAVQILQILRFTNGELSLLFVSDGTMRSFNRCYRKIDQTTDVLSFPFQEFPLPKNTFPSSKGIPIPLGDIIISIPRALKQAKERNISKDSELFTLLVHGILHLFGYDHERSETEAKKMRRKELLIQKAFRNQLPVLTKK